jgi:intracellular sulfur oxidation DsrE/DsrF family protein
MKETAPIADQTLASFVDDALDVIGRAQVIAAMEEDRVVRDKVYRLRRAKDLMQLGFASARSPGATSADSLKLRPRRVTQRLVAGLVVLLLVFGAGQLGYRLAASHHTRLAASQPVRTVNPDHVILHIGQADRTQFAAALVYAEAFLKKTRPGQRQIAIITHAGGIDFLRQDVSPYEKQIKRLMSKYRDVYFIACATAIGQLRNKGVSPRIMTNVDTSKPAMDQIIERVQSGWRYVKVATLAAEASGS